MVDTAGLDPASGAYANGQTVGGKTLVTGDTVLRAGASAQEKNGMWVVPASGAAARHGDYDTWDEHLGKIVAILLGAGNDDVYLIAADPGGALDSTAIPVSLLYGSATNTVEGLVKVSTQASSDTGTATDEALRVVDAAGTYSPVTRKIRTISGTTDTLVLADAGRLLLSTNAGAVTVTVPPNASAAFAIGTQVDLIQTGAGQVTFAQGAGVTIRSESSNKKISAQHAAATLVKTATDTWQLFGTLAA